MHFVTKTDKEGWAYMYINCVPMSLLFRLNDRRFYIYRCLCYFVDFKFSGLVSFSNKSSAGSS